MPGLPKIRAEQMAAHRSVAERAFEDEIMAFLASEHPEIVADLKPDVFRSMVQAGVARARSHSLSQRYSISVFVALMFVIAPNFDECPPIRDRFASEGAPPDDVLDGVVGATSPGEWLVAKDMSDPAAWGEASALLPERWGAR
jgi:hypothetical protein